MLALASLTPPALAGSFSEDAYFACWKQAEYVRPKLDRSVVCAVLKDAVYVRDRRSRVAGMPLAGSKVICGLISITASGSTVNR
jgi:hypothetical protein